jgi:hypothetical protein
MTARTVDEVRSTFVPPADFEDAVAFARRHRVVVVRMPAELGKHITGYRLLDRTGSSSVRILDPREGLNQLPPDRISPGAGYLLVGLRQTQVDELSWVSLARLESALSDQGARLVVVVANALHFGDSGLDERMTEIRGRPEPRTVVYRHLRWHLAADHDQADTVLARSDVRELIDEETSRDRSPRRAALLARLLAEGAGKPATVVNTVRDALACMEERAVGEWFRSLPDLHTRSFVISLAVLNGLPNETVAEVGRLLYRKLSQAPGAKIFPSGHRVELDRITVRTPAAVVEFIEPEDAGVLLRHVWKGYGDTRLAISQWLRDLRGHPAEAVRVRAGIAVGALNTVDTIPGQRS